MRGRGIWAQMAAFALGGGVRSVFGSCARMLCNVAVRSEMRWGLAFRGLMRAFAMGDNTEVTLSICYWLVDASVPLDQ